MRGRTIKVDTLARVEGEGSLLVRMQGQKVLDVKLGIFEPPRFFEAFLRGRHLAEAPDITARICGICPVAYQITAVQAMEAALGVTVPPSVSRLRRLLYCGEWIESHALHIYLLHAPDFLGYDDAIGLAKDAPAEVRRGLTIKKIGNALVTLLGGREIHPINVKVGGFYRVPPRRDLSAMLDDLRWARDAALETVRWTATFEFPELERDYQFVSLHHPAEYPIDAGRIVGPGGLDVDAAAYESEFVEEHAPHSHALRSLRRTGDPYLVGPLARYATSSAHLPPLAREAASLAGLGTVCRNPFRSILVRGVELVFACEEAIRLIETYEPDDGPAVAMPLHAGVGHAATEAPRGLLYHRYRVDDAGLITEARIVPPTAQNQRTIEDDLRQFVERHLSLGDKELTWQCEQAVRNYDPCISCATHFLKLSIERR